MRKHDIKRFAIYSIEKPNKSIIEIKEIHQESNSVEAIVYSSSETFEEMEFAMDDIIPIPINKDLLKALSFDERNGPLYGLPLNEHYYCKITVDGSKVTIVDDDNVLKLVIPNANAFYGCEFVVKPYLHQLQDYIGRVDLQLLSYLLK